MTTTNNTPEVIEDAELDQANGGLLLPAVQKVREAAARLSTTQTPDVGGVNVRLGDGSVRSFSTGVGL